CARSHSNHYFDYW
nr:immunoglobulin heavy chain junction region [Mus musculus]